MHKKSLIFPHSSSSYCITLNIYAYVLKSHYAHVDVDKICGNFNLYLKKKKKFKYRKFLVCLTPSSHLFYTRNKFMVKCLQMMFLLQVLLWLNEGRKLKIQTTTKRTKIFQKMSKAIYPVLLLIFKAFLFCMSVGIEIASCVCLL